jgi:hypothetical protein
MLMEWMAARRDGAAFKSAATFNGIYLLENTQAPSGPYFLQRLDAWPSAWNDIDLQSSTSRWQSLSIDYRGAVPGYVVVPMNGARDWHFSANGKDIQAKYYLGVMPALAVEGPTHIVAVFEPLSIKVGRWIVLATVTTLVLIGFGWRVSGRRTAIRSS